MESPLSHSPRNRTAQAITAAVAGIALLAACSGSPSDTQNDSGADSADSASTAAANNSQEPTSGGDIVYGIPSWPDCVDKTIKPQSPTAFNVVYDLLIAQDPETAEFVPWLATEWHSEDDGKRWVFSLRDDVTFSNGEALNAQVVVDNLDTSYELYQQGVRSSNIILQYYDGAEAVDEYTVAIKQTTATAAFLHTLSTIAFGIVAPETLATSPEERCANGAITSGPFVVSEVVASESFKVTKREGYDWGSDLARHEGEAYLDSITFRLISEESVRVGSLLSGEIQGFADLANDSLPQFENDDYTIVFGINEGRSKAIRFNVSDSILQDVNVRRAILKGVNKEEVVSTFSTQWDNVATSPLTSKQLGWIDLSDKLAYDPDGAKQLLEDAGWTVGADGFREKDGTRLSFSLYFRADSFRQQPLELIQEQLKQIGVDLVLQPSTLAEYTAQLQSGDWQAYYTGDGSLDPNVLLAQDPEREGYKNGAKDDVAALVNQQSLEIDIEKRKELLAQIQNIIVDQAYEVPVEERSLIHVTSSRLHDVWLTADPYWVVLYDAWLEQD